MNSKQYAQYVALLENATIILGFKAKVLINAICFELKAIQEGMQAKRQKDVIGHCLLLLMRFLRMHALINDIDIKIPKCINVSTLIDEKNNNWIIDLSKIDSAFNNCQKEIFAMEEWLKAASTNEQGCPIWERCQEILTRYFNYFIHQICNDISFSFEQFTTSTDILPVESNNYRDQGELEDANFFVNELADFSNQLTNSTPLFCKTLYIYWSFPLSDGRYTLYCGYENTGNFNKNFAILFYSESKLKKYEWYDIDLRLLAKQQPDDNHYLGSNERWTLSPNLIKHYLDAFYLGKYRVIHRYDQVGELSDEDINLFKEMIYDWKFNKDMQLLLDCDLKYIATVKDDNLNNPFYNDVKIWASRFSDLLIRSQEDDKIMLNFYTAFPKFLILILLSVESTRIYANKEPYPSVLRAQSNQFDLLVLLKLDSAINKRGICLISNFIWRMIYNFMQLSGVTYFQKDEIMEWITTEPSYNEVIFWLKQNNDFTFDLWKDVIEKISIKYGISQESTAIYSLREIAESEINIAQFIKQFICSKSLLPYFDDANEQSEIEIWIAEFEEYYQKIKHKKINILDTPAQCAAVKCFFNKNLTLVTGTAGGGKSMVILCIIYILLNKLDLSNAKIIVASKTGIAVSLLETKLEELNLSKKITFTTLDSWIARETAITKSGNLSPEKYFPKIVIIDEMSMVEVDLFAQSIMRCFVSLVRMLIVGDAAQLPSVGVGNLFSDLLSSKLLKNNTILLTQPKRSEETVINDLANDIRASDFSLTKLIAKYPSVFEIIDGDDGDVLKRIKQYYADILKSCHTSDPIVDDHTMVLTPYNAGLLGVANLNRILQKTYCEYFSGKNDKHLNFGLGLIRPGTKIMFVENLHRNDHQMVSNQNMQMYSSIYPNLELDRINLFYNGTRAWVAAIVNPLVRCYFDNILLISHKALNAINPGDAKNPVKSKRGVYYLAFNNRLTFVLGYAFTIHKSQGNEDENVIVYLKRSAFMNKNLFYTAVTRSIKNLHIIILKKDIPDLSKILHHDESEQRDSLVDYFLDN